MCTKAYGYLDEPRNSQGKPSMRANTKLMVNHELCQREKANASIMCVCNRENDSIILGVAGTWLSPAKFPSARASNDTSRHPAGRFNMSSDMPMSHEPQRTQDFLFFSDYWVGYMHCTFLNAPVPQVTKKAKSPNYARKSNFLVKNRSDDHYKCCIKEFHIHLQA